MIWNWSQSFNELNALRREMDEIFNRSHHFITGSSSQSPAINLYQDSNQLTLVTPLPGLKQADLDISFVNGTLTLKGQPPKPELGDHYEILRSERSQTAFEKTVRIPVDIDADQIQASLNDGILSVVLPKAEKAKARQIKIQ